MEGAGIMLPCLVCPCGGGFTTDAMQCNNFKFLRETVRQYQHKKHVLIHSKRGYTISMTTAKVGEGLNNCIHYKKKRRIILLLDGEGVKKAQNTVV